MADGMPQRSAAMALDGRGMIPCTILRTESNDWHFRILLLYLKFRRRKIPRAGSASDVMALQRDAFPLKASSVARNSAFRLVIGFEFPSSTSSSPFIILAAVRMTSRTHAIDPPPSFMSIETLGPQYRNIAKQAEVVNLQFNCIAFRNISLKGINIPLFASFGCKSSGPLTQTAASKRSVGEMQLSPKPPTSIVEKIDVSTPSKSMPHVATHASYRFSKKHFGAMITSSTF
mmetsp:Transcript_7184/g.9322  ORF Transcript_7184/g.9322 Transcript_7184/m.9322 type:complete len:231 (-) Transcript_7184:2993-3685(-)